MKDDSVRHHGRFICLRRYDYAYAGSYRVLAGSATVFDEKIEDKLAHDIRAGAAGLLHQDPEAALEGAGKVVGQEQLDFGERF